MGQYTEFLNAVAKTSDPNGLWTQQVVISQTGIVRSGTNGNYSYSTIGSPNLPARLISWGKAARFANWMHNGQPTGPQNASTTEDGAYTLPPDVTPGNGHSQYLNVTRNADARWFLPSENEWYKAAYFHPTGNGGEGAYSYFPMGKPGDVTYPYSDQPPGDEAIRALAGNFYRDDGIANGYNDGYAITGLPVNDPLADYWADVGSYAYASSYYGTFDQGGNVSEWTESVWRTDLAYPYRIMRGGSAGEDAEQMGSFNRQHVEVSVKGSNGFRLAAIATVPEPSAIALTLSALAGVALWGWRRSRQSVFG